MEVHAKVVSVAAGGSVTVRFTALPADIDRGLRELVADARRRLMRARFLALR